MRPSVLVAVKALQNRPPRFKAEAFLESWPRRTTSRRRRGLRPGSTVKLVDVYSVLTVMPGAAREYSKQEFARDLYLLDQSGVDDHAIGRMLSLPASALTRGSGVLRPSPDPARTRCTPASASRGRHVIAASDYAEFLDAEYLAEYVPTVAPR